MKTKKFINSDMTEQRRSEDYGLKFFRVAEKLQKTGELLEKFDSPETDTGPTISKKSTDIFRGT